MIYRVEVRSESGEWTPLSNYKDFESAAQSVSHLWTHRRRDLTAGVRLIDVARELIPDCDPVVLLMEQRRTT